MSGEATIKTDSRQSRPIKVLQITDTHLFEDPDGCLLGLNTDQSLAAVIEDAMHNHLPADLVLATGDLAHVPSPATYARAVEHLGKLGLPVYCLPGNHDEGHLMDVMADGGHCHHVAGHQQGDWQFVFLDSTIPDSEGAHFSEASLQALDQQLQHSTAAHALVCLHHNPVTMDSCWLDTMTLDNPDAFFAVIDRHPRVRGILWGHVHQEYHAERNGVQLLASPSTCIQFLPNSHEFALDTVAPGYRWLLLQADGTIETGVQRLTQVPGTVDITASGY